MSLSGLEDFGDCDSIVNQIEKLLLDRVLYVEVVSRNKDQNGPAASVMFYDTHGPDDINLNSELSKQILQNTVIAPKLDVVSISFSSCLRKYTRRRVLNSSDIFDCIIGGTSMRGIHFSRGTGW